MSAQFFNCAAQSGSLNDDEGVTILTDGFNAANLLRQRHPDAFAFLSSTEVMAQCLDQGVRCFIPLL
jgi:hypothetical protein